MKIDLFWATSSPSCANYALRRVAADNKSQFQPKVLKTIHHNFYVDDSALCSRSIAAGKKNLIAACSKGGFQL